MRDPPGTTGADITIAARAGDHIDVFGLGDVCNLVAGSGGWTVGDELKSDASGYGVTIGTTGDQEVGAIALETAVAGAKAKVLVVRYVRTYGPSGLTALTDNSGGATADGTIGAVT